MDSIARVFLIILVVSGAILFGLTRSQGVGHSLGNNPPLGMGIVVGSVLLVAVVSAFIQYSTFRYEVSNDGIKTESGLISKSFKTIPFSKVQDVRTTQGITERMLGLCTLWLDTAGTGRIEGVISGITLEEGESIKNKIIIK